MGGDTLYEKVTEIAEDYFGPAAPRFVSRLITSHLDKTPTQLSQADLPELTSWITLTVTMLTEDVVVVNGFVERLQNLTAKQRIP